MGASPHVTCRTTTHTMVSATFYAGAVTDRHHKPVSMSPWRLEASEAEEEALWRLHPERQRLVAADTASLLVRESGAERPEMLARLKTFVDEEGLDTLAQLWSRAEKASLPRALWRLFQIREQITLRPHEIGQLVQRGLDSLDTIDTVIIAATQPVTAESVRGIIEEILSGTFADSLEEALQRASSLARLVSAGLLDFESKSDVNTALTSLAWSDVADELALCANRERSGNLR